MLKKFLTIFLMLFTFQSVSAKDVRIIQITDSHFATLGQGYSERDVAPSEKVLTDAINDINKIKNKSFVMFTGDNIDKPNPDELKRFLKIANKLNCPYYVVIGNHEVSKYQQFSKKDYMQIVRRHSKNCRPRKPNYVFKKDGLVFLVVDGAKETIPGASGYFKEDTLKWLDKTLKKYENKNVVIFQHFPIEAPYFNKTHRTFDVDGYKTILDKHHNVIAIASGHYHANNEKMVDGIYHISTPSLLEDEDHNYKIIDIQLNGRKKPRIYTQTRHAE
ncbi:metallophosphoesterase [bacterium]|nr:metallophosphoesterase [bacterium]